MGWKEQYNLENYHNLKCCLLSDKHVRVGEIIYRVSIVKEYIEEDTLSLSKFYGRKVEVDSDWTGISTPVYTKIYLDPISLCMDLKDDPYYKPCCTSILSEFKKGINND